MLISKVLVWVATRILVEFVTQRDGLGLQAHLCTDSTVKIFKGYVGWNDNFIKGSPSVAGVDRYRDGNMVNYKDITT
jgi:hypothetical protein